MAAHRRLSKHPNLGFTLIEMLVTMAVIALLASLALPHYFGSLDKSKETILKEDLHQFRDALDKFYGDQGRYPANLDELVSKKYLRRIPPDPVTDSEQTWTMVPPSDPKQGGVYDIKSGAPGNARDGTAYASW